jgi:type I restriction enzyme S subunit
MSEWKMTTLGKIADVRDGTHDSPKPQNEGEFLITSRHIKNGKIDFLSAYKISQADYNDVNRRSKVHKWDVLFSMIGTIGEMAIIDFEPNFAIKNIGLFKTNGDYILSKWIYYYFKSDEAKAEIAASLKGSTQQYISLGDLRCFPIVTPPPDEQRAITAVLSSLDDKIDLLHRQNATLEAMAEALFRQWFVDSPTGRLDSIANVTMGQSPRGESYNEDGKGTIFFQGRGEFGWRFPTIRLYTTEPLRMALKGDILMSVRAPVGDINIAGQDCCIGRGLAAIHSKYPTFTLYALKEQREQLKNFNSEGTVFGAISKNDLNGLEIALPGQAHGFEEQFSIFDQKIEKNFAQIRTLENLRDTLLPKLMSGEVRVS